MESIIFVKNCSVPVRRDDGLRVGFGEDRMARGQQT